MAPVEIQGKLRALRTRLRGFFLIDGLSRLAAVAVAVLAVCIFFDWLTSPRLPGFMRWAMLLGGLGLVGHVFWRRLVAPLRISLTEDDMAIAVERANPQLADRLISTVQLAREEQLPEFGASREMVRALASETAASTAAMDFRRTLDGRALRGKLIAGGAAIAFALAVSAAAPNSVLTGLARYFAPFSAAKWDARTRLAVQEPPLLLARGEPLEIEVRQEGIQRGRGTISYRYPGGSRKWQRQRILAGDDGVLRARIAGLAEGVEFFVEAGDGRSRVHAVEVVERPRVEGVTLRYIYPPYTGREPELGAPGKGGVRAVVGTRVRLGVRLNQRVKRARLLVAGGAPVDMKIDSASKGRFAVGELVVAKGGEYRIKLESQHLRTDAAGRERRFTFENLRPARFRIRAEADGTPSILVSRPGRNLDVLPSAVISLRAEARDDFGVASARIRYALSNLEGEKDIALSSAGFGTRAAGLVHEWHLAALKLAPGTAVSYRFEARDFRDKPGPNLGASQVYHLRVVDRSKFDSDTVGREGEIRAELIRIIREETGNKGKVDALRAALFAGKPFGRGARHRAALAESGQRAIARRTGKLRERVDALLARLSANRVATAEDEERLGGMSRALGGLAGGKMPAAADQIRDGRLSKKDPARARHLAGAGETQARILAELNALLEKARKWDETDQLLRLARALLRKQRGITKETIAAGRSGKFRAREVTGLGAEAKTELERLRRDQVGAAADMSDLEEKMASALGRTADAFARAKIGEALRIAQDIDAAPGLEPAPTAERRSVRGMMTGAAKGLAALRFGSAAGQQKQTVGALERIVKVLARRTERDYQAAGRDLREIREAVGRLIAQENRHIRDTGKLTGENPGRPTGAAGRRAAGRIASAQERTRKGTIKLRKKIDEAMNKHNLPKLEKAGDKASSSAGSQGKAVGKLGGGKPGAAMEDEKDARDDLESIRRDIDKEIKKVDDAGQQEELFKIEKELKEILAAHNEVMFKTLAVARFRRDHPKARLGHPQETRLFEATRKETEITGRTRKTVKRLTESPVFAWVLDDTAGDMQEVSDQLEKKKTGIYVQEIEKDIKRNLEDLIAALKKERQRREQRPKPPPPPGGGNPPPGGKPPLVPPLAELKMIRTMQAYVNRKTKLVDRMVARTTDGKLTGELRALLERTSQKQGDVAKVTRDLADMLARPRNERGRM